MWWTVLLNNTNQKEYSMRKYISSTLVVVAVITCIANACSKANEASLNDGATCDTTAVSYSTDVVNILSNHCYECHGANSTAGSGGIDLSTYGNLKIHADAGHLVAVITHAPGFPAMPYGRPKLDDCSINKITAWVNQGAKNN
jgi:uncharacterized membrane protein